MHALKNISFSVEKNEVLGYLGPNGAGKTTTLKIMTGLNSPTSGNMEILGKPAKLPASRMNLGYLPEGPYFYEHLSAEEALFFYGSLFGLRRNAIRKRVDFLLDRMGLQDARHRKLGTYSKGMRQRLGFAQCLINDPEIVVLDEPMSGLDPMGRQEIRDAILDLKSKGKTILMSSHILHDVEMICSRVILLNKGVIKKDAPIQELLQSTRKNTEIFFSAGGNSWQESLEGFKYNVLQDGTENIMINLNPDQDVSGAIKKLVEGKCRILSVVPKNETLEDYFVRVARE